MSWGASKPEDFLPEGQEEPSETQVAQWVAEATHWAGTMGHKLRGWIATEGGAGSFRALMVSHCQVCGEPCVVFVNGSIGGGAVLQMRCDEVRGFEAAVKAALL